jgi:hypothetical protein
MLVRWLVIGGVALVALTVYALVDLFVTQSSRVRAFPKAVWIAVIVVMPVIGSLLWLFIGKNPRTPKQTTPMFPDDDMGFLGRIDRESAEERIRRLEEELRQLDEEELPEVDSSNPTPERKKKDGDGTGQSSLGNVGDDDDDDDNPADEAGSSAPRS